MHKEEIKLLMIFKLTKRGEESYNYRFESLALAIAKDNDFTILAGNFAEKKQAYFDRIVDDGNMLLRNTSNVIVGNPRQNATGYAYYEIPFNNISKQLNSIGIKDKVQQLISLCALGDSTELIWYGSNNPLQFKTVKRNMNYYEANIRSEKEIVDMLLGRNQLEFIKLQNDKILPKTIEESISQVGQHSQTQVKTLKMDMSNIDINEIIAQIKDKIIGQDEAVEAVVSNIYANQRIIETGNHDLISTQKASILLDGPTGTGKTAIIKEVADRLSLPVVITSATAYSGTGYVGGSLTDILVKLLDKTKGNLELAQRGIVCLDEIDKLGQSPNETNNLKMKTAVQQELLTFISGTKFDIEYMGKTVEFDTSSLTFIGMGAFTKIREQKIAEKIMQSKKHTTIGFASSDESKEQENDNTYVMTAQDYINFGLERELIGRFSLLTSTKSYSIDDYKNILVKSSISPLKMFVEFAKSFGVESITYDDDFIQMIAEMAYKDNFGARGLQKIVSNLKNSLLLEIMNSKTKSIILTTEMLKKAEEKNIRSF